MPSAGEDHGEPRAVGRFDDILVMHRAAGLDHGRRAGFRRSEKPIGERKEGIGGDDRAFRETFRKARRLRRLGGLLRGDPGRIDPAHLPGPDPDRRALLRIDDRIGFDIFGDAKRKFEIVELGRRRRSFGDDAQIHVVDDGIVAALHEKAAGDGLEEQIGPARIGQAAGDEKAEVRLRRKNRERVLVDRRRDDDFGEDLGDLLRGCRVERAGSSAMMPPKAETGSQRKARR